MSKTIYGTFSGNGDSDVIVASQVTFLVGTSAASNFGSGTITIEAEYGDKGETTTIYSFTEEGAKTTEEFVGGARFKLTMADSTSPDCDYAITYK